MLEFFVLKIIYMFLPIYLSIYLSIIHKHTLVYKNKYAYPQHFL